MHSIYISVLCFIISLVFAAPVYSVEIKETGKYTEQGLPILAGPAKEEMSAVKEEGIDTGTTGVVAPELGVVTAAVDCNTWWIHGDHRWVMDEFWGLTEFRGHTNTYYGSSTDPNACGKPELIVDYISFDGKLRHILGSIVMRLKEVAYNTSNVSASKRKSVSRPCGGRVEHLAVKNGISWRSITRSGCFK